MGPAVQQSQLGHLVGAVKRPSAAVPPEAAAVVTPHHKLLVQSPKQGLPSSLLSLIPSGWAPTSAGIHG